MRDTQRRPRSGTQQPSTRRVPGEPSLREQAYLQIKQLIMECELRPGEQINESSLGAMLAMGRTPIHQALHQLEHERLVSIKPRKGVMVATLSLNDVLETIEVRMANEQLSAALAAERASQAEIEAMREIVERTPALIHARDIPALMRLDLKLHQAISAASRNRVLAELLANLHERQARFWFLSLSQQEHLRETYDEHSMIVDAIASRDAETARHAMARHVREFQRNITRSL